MREELEDEDEEGGRGGGGHATASVEGASAALGPSTFTIHKVSAGRADWSDRHSSSAVARIAHGGLEYPDRCLCLCWCS